MLSRDAILGLTSAIGRHPVPELGGDVGLAEFTAEDADKIGRWEDDGTPFNVRVVIWGACDEAGNRLFTDDDIPLLMKKSSKFVAPLCKAILAYNSLGAEAQAEAKNDSGETENDASASASPSPSGKPSKS